MVEQQTLQDYADMICEDRNVSRASVCIAADRNRKGDRFSTAGSYQYATKKITIYLADEIALDDVRQTILHELSHHMVKRSDDRGASHGRKFYQVLNELMCEYGVTRSALEIERNAYSRFAYNLPWNPPPLYLYPPHIKEYSDPVEYGQAYAKYSKRVFFNEYFTGYGF